MYVFSPRKSLKHVEQNKKIFLSEKDAESGGNEALFCSTGTQTIV